MKRAIIFANGRLEQAPKKLDSLLEGSLVMAADGGARHCQALGIHPAVVIGDFDSLSQDEISAYEHAGVETIRHPSRKDETDLELALSLAQQRGCEDIYLLGALGARWDMSLSNILLLARPSFRGMRISLLDGEMELRVLREDEQAVLQGQPGERLSLIPLAGDAGGITTQGLEYPLNDETLYFGSSRGVSNSLLQSQAQVKLTSGILLCILAHRE